MAQVFFRCSTDQWEIPHRFEARVDNLIDAREQAAQVVRSLVATPALEDWRGWVLHACDDCDEEIFSLPFASVVGRPH